MALSFFSMLSMSYSDAVLFWAMADALRMNTIKILLDAFIRLENIPFDISYAQLTKLGISSRSASSIVKKIATVRLDWAKEILIKKNISVISFLDPSFPHALKNIEDAPLFLFYQGNLSVLPSKTLAVVGTRSPSSDGVYAIEKIIPPLVESGFCIVSGLALGIDALAHKETLKHKGKTIAFLGSGIDRIYPSSHQALASEILHSGIIFSEFPLGTQPEAYNFPRRNRLVSGLSDGVLVVEGKEKSGSLITADFALDQGKEVFAIPGSIRNPLSAGPHKLISQGAVLVQSAQDIFSVFGITQKQSSNPSLFSEIQGMSDIHQKIYSILSHVPVSFDVLLEKISIEASALSSELMMMHLLGYIEESGASTWIRK